MSRSSTAAALNNKIPNFRILIVLPSENNKVKGFEIETSSVVVSFEISHKLAQKLDFPLSNFLNNKTKSDRVGFEL